MHFELGHFAIGVGYANAAMIVYPDLLQPRYCFAVCHSRQGHHKPALIQLQRALRLRSKQLKDGSQQHHDILTVELTRHIAEVVAASLTAAGMSIDKFIGEAPKPMS